MANAAKSLIKIILGVILIGIPIYALIYNLWGSWTAVWLVIKAGIVLGVGLVGLIFLILGFTELK